MMVAPPIIDAHSLEFRGIVIYWGSFFFSYPIWAKAAVFCKQ